MIMAFGILQNGPVPRFVPEEILRQVFSDCTPGPCIAEFRKGFMKLGLYEIAKSLPLFIHLMRPNDGNQLSRKQLLFLLKRSFSDEGTNVRKSAVVDRVQSPLAAFYSLQLGWIENNLFELQPCIQFIAAPENNK